METLRYERLGHVGWLHLNRPQKLNAMTAKMWEEMRILGQELGNDPRGARPRGDRREKVVLRWHRHLHARGYDSKPKGRQSAYARQTSKRRSTPSWSAARRSTRDAENNCGMQNVEWKKRLDSSLDLAINDPHD